MNVVEFTLLITALQIQLASGDTESNGVPTWVKGITQVVHVVCGEFFSAAITQDGAVYTWGRGDSGQLVNSFYSLFFSF